MRARWADMRHNLNQHHATQHMHVRGYNCTLVIIARSGSEQLCRLNDRDQAADFMRTQTFSCVCRSGNASASVSTARLSDVIFPASEHNLLRCSERRQMPLLLQLGSVPMSGCAAERTRVVRPKSPSAGKARKPVSDLESLSGNRSALEKAPTMCVSLSAPSLDRWGSVEEMCVQAS